MTSKTLTPGTHVLCLRRQYVCLFVRRSFKQIRAATKHAGDTSHARFNLSGVVFQNKTSHKHVRTKNPFI